MNLKENAKMLKIYIPALIIAIRKSETPISAKVLASITIGYALSPIDLIPDFIPILGYLDDLIILPILIFFTIKLIPERILNASLVESQNLKHTDKIKKWYYAIPILLIWTLLVIFLIKFLA